MVVTALNRGRPRLLNESRLPLDAVGLFRSATWRGVDVENGEGQPVLTIPGLLAGDDSLATMTTWLRRTGYRTKRAGIRANLDCSEALVERLIERVEEMHARDGRRVAIVGQSRGGLLARVIARRRPDLVNGIVTLGSPHTDCFAIHPFVRAQIIAVGFLGTIGVPGLFKASCQYGHCCKAFMHDLQRPFPEGVGFVSVYSKRDGIVRWKACLDPAAEHVEVTSSHCAMAVDGPTYAAVSAALAAFRAGAAEDAGAAPLAAAA